MSESLPVGDSAPRLTGVQWLICVIAAIGFAFDIYELLMLPLIIRDALMELGGFAQGSDGYQNWATALFYVPAIAGGIFGLVGGYLTDRLGRRRVLTWSILLYAFSAFLAGFSTNLWMLLLFRSTTFIGVCVEFVAAVAWLAELFPNPHQREKVLGYTQAFSSIGGLLVAGAYGLAVAFHNHFPGIYLPEWIAFGGSIKDPHAAWRYTLMSGIIPAIPLIIIRPFLPESPAWKHKKETGILRRPSLGALFSPALRRTTVVTTIMFACSYGAAFGAIQQMPQMVPGLPEVQAKVKEAVSAKSQDLAKIEDPGKKNAARAVVARQTVGKFVPSLSMSQEIGGLVGRVLLAILAVYIVSRRALIRIFQIPGLLLFPLIFGWAAIQGLNYLYVGIFLAGLLTVGQFSFWGNYLPRVYPVHLRGTGESFAANIGGRLIGTSFAAGTLMLTKWLTPANPTPAQAAHTLAYTAAAVGVSVYLVGFIASFFLPEPGSKDIDEAEPSNKVGHPTATGG